jgi:selT/selW/selH-like putative selenoprotein
LEKEIKKRFPDAKIVLQEGSKGIFDVKRDGKLIYSKYQTGRFPMEGEINLLLQ